MNHAPRVDAAGAAVPPPLIAPSTPAAPNLTERILQLRQSPNPLDWRLVAGILNLSPRELRRQRWLIAAQLVADGAGWTDAAHHPAVEFNPDTLRKQHVRAKLPGGLGWGDYVEQYQAALRERTVELQQERGRDVAERLQAIGESALQVAELLQGHLRDCVVHPPEMVTLGPAQSFMTTEKRTQLVLLFPGEKAPEVDDGPPRMRLTLPYARYLRAHQDEVLALAARAARVAQATADSASDDDGLPQSDSAASLESLRAEAELLSAELQRYTQPEDGEAVA